MADRVLPYSLGLAGMSVVFAWLSYLFVKNLLRARNSAEIYNGGLLVHRAESPFLFWFTVGFYALATAFTVICAGLSIFAAAYTMTH